MIVFSLLDDCEFYEYKMYLDVGNVAPTSLQIQHFFGILCKVSFLDSIMISLLYFIDVLWLIAIIPRSHCCSNDN